MGRRVKSVIITARKRRALLRISFIRGVRSASITVFSSAVPAAANEVFFAAAFGLTPSFAPHPAQKTNEGSFCTPH